MGRARGHRGREVHVDAAGLGAKVYHAHLLLDPPPLRFDRDPAAPRVPLRQLSRLLHASPFGLLHARPVAPRVLGGQERAHALTLPTRQRVMLPHLPALSQKKEGPGIIIDSPSESENVDAQLHDQVKTETVIHVGEEGMRIDQELYRKPKYEQFEYVNQNSETIKHVHDTEGIE